jgi:hypothetical protein
LLFLFFSTEAIYLFFFNVLFTLNDEVFKGFVLKNKKKIKFKLKYFVRKKINQHVINEKNVLKLLNQNEFVMKKFGKFLCYSVNCDYLVKRLKKKLFYDNFFLVK